MITINLGFDKNPHAKKEDIFHIFSNSFIIDKDTFNYKEVEAKYIDPETKKEVKETTAVFNVHTKYQFDKEDIDYNIQQLCTIFNQDSIAYYSYLLEMKNVVHNIRYTKKKYNFNANYFKFN